MSRFRRIAAVVAVLLLGGGAYWYLHRTPDQIDADALAVVHRGNLEIVVTETGRIQPQTKVDVKSKVAGQVQAVRVQEGQRVAAGDVLLMLDPRDLERSLSQAQADREIAAAELQGMLAGPRQADLAEARASLAQARARERQATAERDRAAKALAAHALTPREWEQARTEAEAARAASASARSRMDRVQSGVRPEEVARARAQLRKADAVVQSVRDQLAYCVIRSPLAGTVIHRNIQVGELVTPGVAETGNREPLLTVADLRQLVVECEVNQIDVGKLSPGQSVSIRVDTAPGEEFHGKVYKVAPAAVTTRDKDVQLFSVEVQVDAPDEHKLKPGMSADLDIFVRRKTDVLLLPIEAVARGERGTDGVVTVVHKKPQGGWDRSKRHVTLGSSSDSEVEIRSGVADGDQIYIDPGPAKDNTNHF